ASKVDEWPHHKKKNKRALLLKRDGNIVSVTEGQKNKPSQAIHEAANSDSKRSILLCLGQKTAKNQQSISRGRTYELQLPEKPDQTSPIHLVPRLDSKDDGPQAMCLHHTVHEGNFSAPSCCDVIPHQSTCPHTYIRLTPHLPVQNRDFLTISTAYTDDTSDFATPVSYIQDEEVDDFQLSASLPSRKQNLHNTSASFIDSGWGSMSPMASDLCNMGYPTRIETQPIKRREHRSEREHKMEQDTFLGRFSKSEGFIMFLNERSEQTGMKSLTEGHGQEIVQHHGSKNKRSPFGAVYAAANQNPSPKEYGKSPSAADIREMSGQVNLYPKARSGDLMFEGVWRKSAADRSIAQQQKFSLSVPVLRERDVGLPLPPLFVTNKVDNKSSTKDQTPFSKTKSSFLETCPPVNIPENKMYSDLCETELSGKFASVRPKLPDLSKKSVRRIKRDSVHSRLSDEFQEASEPSSTPSFGSDYVVASNQDSVATARYRNLMYIDQNLGEQGYPAQTAIEKCGPSPVMKCRSMSALRLEEQVYDASRTLKIRASEKQGNAETEAVNIRSPISPKYKAKTPRRSYTLVHQVDELMAKLDGLMGKPEEKVLSGTGSWMITPTDGAESTFDPHISKRGLSQVPHNMEGNTDGDQCTDNKNRLYNECFSSLRSEQFGDGPELTEDFSPPTAIISETTTNTSYFSALNTEQFVEKFIEDDMAFFDQTSPLMHSTLVEDTSEFCSPVQETSADVCTQASASTSDLYVQELNNTTETGLCPNSSVDLDFEEQQPQVKTDQARQSAKFADVSEEVDSICDKRKSEIQEGIVSSKLFPTTSEGSRHVGHDGDGRDEVDSGLDLSSYSSRGANQSNSESTEKASGTSKSQYQASIAPNVESTCQPDNQSLVSKADAEVISTYHSPLISAMLRTVCDTPTYGTEQCAAHFSAFDNETTVELGVPSLLVSSPPAVQQKQLNPCYDQMILVPNSSNSALCIGASSLTTPSEKSSISEWQKNKLEGWQLTSATTDDGINDGVSVGGEFQSAVNHFRTSPNPPETADDPCANPEVRKGTDDLGLKEPRGIPTTSSVDEKDDRDDTEWNLAASIAHQATKDVNDHPNPEIPHPSNQSEISKSLASNLAAPCGYTAHLSQYVSDSILECEPSGEYFGVSAFAHTTPTAKLRYIAHGLEVVNQMAPHITEAVLIEYQGNVVSSTPRQSKNEAREQRMEQETSDLIVLDESCDLSDNTSDEKVRMSGQIAHTHELSNNDSLTRHLSLLDMQSQDSKYHDITPDFSPAHLKPSSPCLLCANKAYQMMSEVTDSKGVLSPGDFRMPPTMQTTDQPSRDGLECDKRETPEIPNFTLFSEGADASSVDEKATCESSSELHRQMSSVENENSSYSHDAQPLGEKVREQRQWWSTQYSQLGENETETPNAFVLNENLLDLGDPPDNSIDQTVGGLFASLSPRVHSSFDEDLSNIFELCRQTAQGINQQHTYFTEATESHAPLTVEGGACFEIEHPYKQAETLVRHNIESGITGVIHDMTLEGEQQQPALRLLPVQQDISTPTASTQLSPLNRWSAWAFASLTSTFHF
ncbi:hypothetical protein X801_10235, partial [Opisthorchis viverrini]